MPSTLKVYKYDIRGQTFCQLSGFRTDFDCHDQVALLKASDADIYLCLGCAGTVPEAQLESHMRKNHKLVIQENVINCDTCRCVAGVGTEAASMHFHSTRHAGVVRAKGQNYCLQCCAQVPKGVKHGHPHITSFQSIVDDNNVNIKSVAQEYKADSYVRATVARGQKISQVQTKIEKTALALVALSGAKVSGTRRGDTKQAGTPALCERHLTDLGFDRSGSSPGYEIIQARACCKACQGAERLAGEKADESKPTYHILVKVEDMKEKPTAANIGTPVEVDPADFTKINKKFIHMYTYCPVKQKFIRPVESDGSDYEFDETDGASAPPPYQRAAPSNSTRQQDHELSDDDQYVDTQDEEQA